MHERRGAGVGMGGKIVGVGGEDPAGADGLAAVTGGSARGGHVDLDLGDDLSDGGPVCGGVKVAPARQRRERDRVGGLELPRPERLAPPTRLVLGGAIVPGAGEGRAVGEGVDGAEESGHPWDE